MAQHEVEGPLVLGLYPVREHVALKSKEQHQGRRPIKRPIANGPNGFNGFNGSNGSVANSRSSPSVRSVPDVPSVTAGVGGKG